MPKMIILLKQAEITMKVSWSSPKTFLPLLLFIGAIAFFLGWGAIQIGLSDPGLRFIGLILMGIAIAIYVLKELG